MTAEPDPPGKLSLRRWSQRKLEASRAAAAPVAPAPPVAPPAVEPPATSADVPAATAPALPPVEMLTPDSDFAAFMQPKVDDALKRQALKKLFSDPRFNVMDGLDVYVDDYTRTIPVPASLLERLAPMHAVFDAPPPVPAADPRASEDVAEGPTATSDRVAPADAESPRPDAATPPSVEAVDEPPSAPDAGAPESQR